MASSQLLHRPPRARVVDRTSFLANVARGKRAIHVGFVDVGLMGTRRAEGRWLHDILAAEAAAVIGIDNDMEGVRQAQELGYEAYAVDCQSAEGVAALGLEPADVVVAGELIEHLDRPGAFLDAVPSLLVPGGVLALSTPNASRLTNFAAALGRREVVSLDHVAWYTWRTLTTLLDRHGFEVEQLAYYGIQHLPAGASLPLRDRVLVRGYNAVRGVATLVTAMSPQLADGVLVVARARS